MRLMTFRSWQVVACAGLLAAGIAGARAGSVQAQGAVTAFEGARVISGEEARRSRTPRSW